MQPAKLTFCAPIAIMYINLKVACSLGRLSEFYNTIHRGNLSCNFTITLFYLLGLWSLDLTFWPF